MSTNKELLAQLTIEFCRLRERVEKLEHEIAEMKEEKAAAEVASYERHMAGYE